jgi:hypothetical protein
MSNIFKVKYNPLNVKGLTRIPSNDHAMQYTGKRLLTRVSDLAGIEASRSEIQGSFPRESKEPRISLDRQLELLEISRELGNPCGLKCDPPCHRAAM